MRSRAHQMEIIPCDLINQQPVRLDVAIAMMTPVANQRMISKTSRQLAATRKQQNHSLKLL